MKSWKYIGQDDCFEYEECEIPYTNHKRLQNGNITPWKKNDFFPSMSKELQVQVWERVTNGKAGVSQLEIKISVITGKLGRRWFQSQPDAPPSHSTLNGIYLPRHWHSGPSPGLPFGEGGDDNEPGGLAPSKEGAPRAHSPCLPRQISHILLGEKGEGIKTIALGSRSSLPSVQGGKEKGISIPS